MKKAKIYTYTTHSFLHTHTNAISDVATIISQYISSETIQGTNHLSTKQFFIKHLLGAAECCTIEDRCDSHVKDHILGHIFLGNSGISGVSGILKMKISLVIFHVTSVVISFYYGSIITFIIIPDIT